MDTYRIPSIAEVMDLSPAAAVELYESIVPIAALLRARILAGAELARPTESARVETRERSHEMREAAIDVETWHDVELTVQRVNRSGRVVFETPRGIASAVPTNATRDKLRRMRAGQVVRVRSCEIATLPNSGGRQVLRAVELR